MGERAGSALRRGSDRIIAGVCSGLGDKFGFDRTLVRIVFVILVFIPPAIGLVAYLVLWLLMEPPAPAPGATPAAAAGQGAYFSQWRRGARPGGFWVGIILIALGAFFLLGNLGFLSFIRWDVLWPVLLIALGLLVLLRRLR